MLNKEFLFQPKYKKETVIAKRIEITEEPLSKKKSITKKNIMTKSIKNTDLQQQYKIKETQSIAADTKLLRTKNLCKHKETCGKNNCVNTICMREHCKRSGKDQTTMFKYMLKSDNKMSLLQMFDGLDHWT